MPSVRRSRRAALGLAVTLMAVAAVRALLAALLEDQAPSQSLDPHHTGVITEGGFAAVFCIVALWRLREVGRGRTGWLAAGFWFALAVLALLVMDAVALASRLGG